MTIAIDYSLSRCTEKDARGETAAKRPERSYRFTLFMPFIKPTYIFLIFVQREPQTMRRPFVKGENSSCAIA